MDSLFKINKDGSKNAPNTEKYAKQAENIWSMLDDMATSDLESYKLVWDFFMFAKIKIYKRKIGSN